MKRIRITLAPTGDYAPPVYRLLAGGASYLDRVEICNWNVATPPTAFLLWLRGDYRRFETELETRENVHEYEILPIADRECHCFFEGAVSSAARSLFENFTRVVCSPSRRSSVTTTGPTRSPSSVRRPTSRPRSTASPRASP